MKWILVLSLTISVVLVALEIVQTKNFARQKRAADAVRTSLIEVANEARDRIAIQQQNLNVLQDDLKSRSRLLNNSSNDLAAARTKLKTIHAEHTQLVTMKDADIALLRKTREELEARNLDLRKQMDDLQQRLARADRELFITGNDRKLLMTEVRLLQQEKRLVTDEITLLRQAPVIAESAVAAATPARTPAKKRWFTRVVPAFAMKGAERLMQFNNTPDEREAASRLPVRSRF